MGELQVRGPTSAMMYWNNREQSRETFLGEWTRSGDKYLEDEDGYFVYCGRRDDMLKVGGIYVSPFEVEGALCTHPDVLEAAVVAWPDEDELIKPKAFVVLKSADKAGDDARARAAGARASSARALQISALDRVPRRAAEDRDRQDPALQAAGGSSDQRDNVSPRSASCRKRSIAAPRSALIRLEGWGRPHPAASCFETHRSATMRVELHLPASRCDAPQHEAERGHARGNGIEGTATSMRKTFLGRTGLEISELAFGGGVTGGILINPDEADPLRRASARGRRRHQLDRHRADLRQRRVGGDHRPASGRADSPRPHVSTKVRLEERTTPTTSPAPSSAAWSRASRGCAAIRSRYCNCTITSATAPAGVSRCRPSRCSAAAASPTPSTASRSRG